MSETIFKNNASGWDGLEKLVNKILDLLREEGFEKKESSQSWDFKQYKEEDFIEKKRASEKTISGEMFWFYKKTSTEWPQEKDINRNGYCLYLTEGRFQFELRCFCNNGGAIISENQEIYFQCMKEFREKCKSAGWRVDDSANIEKQHGGLKIIICEFNADSDSMEEFVKKMVDWDKNNIDKFNDYRIETIEKGENLGGKKMNDPEKLLEKIKELTDSNQNLRFIKNGKDKKSQTLFLQYAPKETDEEIWAEKKCHYEFHLSEKQQELKICFHSEGEFTSNSRLCELLSKKIKAEKEPSPKVCGFDYKIINLNGEEEVAQNAVDAMNEFIDECGPAIEESIKQSMEDYDMDNIDEKIKEEVKELLLNNHNIILNGAPGTGKTYLARDIAIDLIFENEDDRKLIRKKEEEIQEEEKKTYSELNNKLDEQYCFVQFHQSYDYTDFVEGLRPCKKEDSKDIVFEPKDGIFKDFCKRAIKAPAADFDSIYEIFVQDIKQKDVLLKTPSLGNNFYVRVGEGGGLKAVPEKSGKEMSVSKKELKAYYEFGTDPNNRESKIPPISDYLKRNYNRKYIFVIDEINRGEMSKIFGELFFSIDPGYRGKKGKIKTQYANLQEEPNDFDTALGIEKNEKGEGQNKVDQNKGKYGNFFVPENVYIIGTMNDIDRSVESMDFAMRRRFAFKEITADNRKGMLDELGDKRKDAENVMTALNKAIEEIGGLSSAYHIGPAYFLKLKKYNGDDNFDKLWNNHIAGVIKEYLRGIDTKDDAKFKGIEEAYYKAVKSESDKDGGAGNAAEQPLPQEEIPNA